MREGAAELLGGGAVQQRPNTVIVQGGGWMSPGAGKVSLVLEWDQVESPFQAKLIWDSGILWGPTVPFQL